MKLQRLFSSSHESNHLAQRVVHARVNGIGDALCSCLAMRPLLATNHYQWIYCRLELCFSLPYFLLCWISFLEFLLVFVLNDSSISQPLLPEVANFIFHSVAFPGGLPWNNVLWQITEEIKHAGVTLREPKMCIRFVISALDWFQKGPCLKKTSVKGLKNIQRLLLPNRRSHTLVTQFDVGFDPALSGCSYFPFTSANTSNGEYETK